LGLEKNDHIRQVTVTILLISTKRTCIVAKTDPFFNAGVAKHVATNQGCFGEWRNLFVTYRTINHFCSFDMENKTKEDKNNESIRIFFIKDKKVVYKKKSLKTQKNTLEIFLNSSTVQQHATLHIASA
jgi:hypothetical protein